MKWKIKVKGLRNLLSNNDSNEEAKKASNKIVKLITNNPRYLNAFRNFDRLYDFANYVETTTELNDLLNDMYDYCDKNSIWIDFD